MKRVCILIDGEFLVISAPGDDLNVISNKTNCFLIVPEAGRNCLGVFERLFLGGHWKC